MEKLIKMLEALVSQGEAQFLCEDEYATFNKDFIERARTTLNQVKDMPTFDECYSMTKTFDHTTLSGVTALTHLIGYMSCLQGHNKNTVKAEVDNILRLY